MTIQVNDLGWHVFLIVVAAYITGWLLVRVVLSKLADWVLGDGQREKIAKEIAAEYVKKYPPK